MILSEITMPSSIETAADILINAGYEAIGSGLAGGKSGGSMVFHKPGEKSVLKLYSSRDTAFTTFADFCIANPNPHFPKFSKRSIQINDNYSAIRTELLRKGSPAELRDPVLYILIYMHIKKGYMNWNANPWASSLYFKKENKARLTKEATAWFKANKSVKTAVDLMLVNLNAYGFDIKMDNIMFRGDTLVFVDMLY